MKKNIWTILIVSVLFGTAVGIYDLVLPLFLERHAVNPKTMGLIFGLPFAITFFLRIYVGRLSDIAGRKVFYSLSLILGAAAHFLTPLSLIRVVQMTLKTIRESAVHVRVSMQSIMVFENAEGKFLDFVGKALGAEYVFHAAGALVVGGLLLASFSYESMFFVAAGLMAVAFVVFIAGFTEQKKEGTEAPRMALREVFSVRRLAPELKIIILASIIFGIGFRCTHSWVMPLFFKNKFGFSVGSVTIIMAVHRLTLGVPMLFVGRLIKSHLNLKWVYIVFLFVQGLTVTLSALPNNGYVATSIWMLHDLFGAGIWIPVHHTLIQKYCRGEQRGHEFSVVLAFSSIGFFIGPILAGPLYEMSVSAPFLYGGLISMFSAVILLRLPD